MSRLASPTRLLTCLLAHLLTCLLAHAFCGMLLRQVLPDARPSMKHCFDRIKVRCCCAAEPAIKCVHKTLVAVVQRPAVEGFARGSGSRCAAAAAAAAAAAVPAARGGPLVSRDGRQRPVQLPCSRVLGKLPCKCLRNPVHPQCTEGGIIQSVTPTKPVTTCRRRCSASARPTSCAQSATATPAAWPPAGRSRRPRRRASVPPALPAPAPLPARSQVQWLQRHVHSTLHCSAETPLLQEAAAPLQRRGGAPCLHHRVTAGCTTLQQGRRYLQPCPSAAG